MTHTHIRSRTSGPMEPLAYTRLCATAVWYVTAVWGALYGKLTNGDGSLSSSRYAEESLLFWDEAAHFSQHAPTMNPELRLEKVRRREREEKHPFSETHVA